MDNEMIERVAKGMFCHLSTNRNPSQNWDQLILNPQHFLTIAHYKNLAIAAIKAMREPTEKMIEAGREAISSCYSLAPGEGFDEEPAPIVWTEMIDAILND